jgi:hypothetical protein
MRPLSDKLIEASEWGIHMPVELRDWLEEAAAIIKRYEDAPVGRLVCTSRGFMAEPEDMNDHRFWSAGRVRILLDTEGV